MSEAQEIDINRGLKGIKVERLTTKLIDGKACERRYRDYSIHDLAEHSTCEETTYLLLDGELPSSPELIAFYLELIVPRQLPPEILTAMTDLSFDLR
jgi:citrate synthase